MPKLKLRKDMKTGEPVKKGLVSATKAENYLVVKAYDNERVVDDRVLEDK